MDPFSESFAQFNGYWLTGPVCVYTLAIIDDLWRNYDQICKQVREEVCSNEATIVILVTPLKTIWYINCIENAWFKNTGRQYFKAVLSLVKDKKEYTVFLGNIWWQVKKITETLTSLTSFLGII